MGKNRIWKRIVSLCFALLLETSIFMGCQGEPVAAEVENGQAPSVGLSEEAAWTDLENFKAKLCINASGLDTLSWQEKEEKEEPESQVGESPEEKYILEVWISEFFLPDLSAGNLRDVCLEEIPVHTQDGRESTIHRVQWEVPRGESEKDLEFCLQLREEYRFFIENRQFPVCQDAPFEKNLEGKNVESGVFLRREAGEESEVIRQVFSKRLEVPATDCGFLLSVKQQGEKAAAGKRCYYEAEIVNPDDFTCYDIALEGNTGKDGVLLVWEKETGVKVTETGAILEKLSGKEKRVLSFYVDIPQKEKGEMNVAVSAKFTDPFPIEKNENVHTVIQPLKADFTVKKTADCESARPGDTVTYQISIHNTGEQTLHSVITTERFALAGVQAVFLEQEGVILNKSKTQAKIPEIVSGGCVNLKARVILPEKLEDQELVNQVIVVSDETGEEEAVRDQTSIKVEKEEKKGRSETKEERRDSAGTQRNSAPKTGDRSGKDVFQALILCSFAISALAARRMFFGRKD